MKICVPCIFYFKCNFEEVQLKEEEVMAENDINDIVKD